MPPAALLAEELDAVGGDDGDGCGTHAVERLGYVGIVLEAAKAELKDRTDSLSSTVDVVCGLKKLMS